MKIPKRRNKSKWFIFAITLILLVAVGTFLYQYYKPQNVVDRAAADGFEIIKDMKINTNPTEEQIEKVSYDTVQEVPNFDTLQKQRKKAKKIVIRTGHVLMPDYKVDVPIYEGTSDQSLSWGAGTAKPNEKMGEGNYAISAHNYLKLKEAKNWFFTAFQSKVAPAGTIDEKLIKPKIGTIVYSYDGDYIYEFKLIKKEVVHFSETSVLSDERVSELTDNNSPLLTMTTCYEESQELTDYRIVLTSELLEKSSVKDFQADDKNKQLFDIEE